MLHGTELDSVIDQVLKGDRDSFWHIVNAFGLSLRSYVASQIHHLEDIDDVTQEVFITAYRKLHTFRRGDEFGNWLRGIARNKMHCYLRSSKRRVRAMERFLDEVARLVGHDLDRASSADKPELIEVLLRCITRLPEKMRRVVRSGLDGEKPAMLAQELVTTVGAIYNLHYRANQLLRECVRKELG
jgi:RNA polymerase sigma-70 factor, ECF subfamily